MHDPASAGFDRLVLTQFCRLDELGLEVTGQRLDLHAVISEGNPTTLELGRVSLLAYPHEDCPEHDASSVDGGELVVAGGQPAPLLVVVEGPLDHVAVLVDLGVERGWSATRTASSPAVTGLVGGCGDHGLDVPTAQQFPVRARGVRLVAQHGIRSGPRRDTVRASSRCFSIGESPLTGGQGDHQRPAAAVDELVDRAAQPTPGPAERMVWRLGLTGQNLVIRLSPL